MVPGSTITATMVDSITDLTWQDDYALAVSVGRDERKVVLSDGRSMPLATFLAPNSLVTLRWLAFSPSGKLSALRGVSADGKAAVYLKGVADPFGVGFALEGSNCDYLKWGTDSQAVCGTYLDSTSSDVQLEHIYDAPSQTDWSLPELVVKDSIWAISPSGDQILTLRPEQDGANLYTKQAEQSQVVFPWIGDFADLSSGTTQMRWEPSGIWIANCSYDRIQIRGPLVAGEENPLSATHLGIKLPPIDLDPGSCNLLWADTEFQSFAIVRATLRPKGAENEHLTRYLWECYVYDTATGSTQSWAMPEGIFIGRVYASPDGSLWAWEAYVDQETRVVVFDRTMGRLIQLNDFTGIIGWVRVP